MEGGIVLSRQELSRLRTILDGVGDSLFLHDLGGRIVAANRRAQEETGYSEEELLHLTVADLSPEAIAAGKHSIWAELGEGHTALVTGAHRRKDGSRYPVEARLSLIRLDDGQALVCALVRDISKRLQTDETLKQVRSQLQEAEARLDKMFERSLAGVYVVAEDRILYANARLAEIYGYSVDELLALPSARQLVHADDQAMVSEHFRRHVEGGLETLCFSFRGMRKSGHIVEVTTYGTATQWGGRQAIFGTTLDVTEERRVQRDLNQQLLFMRQLLEAIPAPVFFKDRQGRYIGCNSAFERQQGRSSADLMGKTVFDVAPRELAERYFAADQALLVASGTQKYETQVRFADGTVHDVMFSKATFPDQDGQVAGLVGVMLDISERKRLEGELRLAASVFDCASEGVLITDANANIIRVNRAYQRITGYAEDELLGRNPSLMTAGLHGPEFYHAMWQMLKERGHWEGEILNRRKNSTPYHSWLSITAVPGSDGKVLNYIGICSDLTERKQSQQQIERLSYFDSLTGLPNRMLMEDRLRQNISSAKRRGGYAALMLADIDRLGKINDTLGHEAGDALLKVVATRIGACIRPGDTLARYVSDEFVIILDDLNSPADAGLVAEKICAAFNDHITIGGQDISTGVSIGISVFPQDGETPEAVLRCADTAKRHVKTEGGSRYQFYSDELNQQSLEHLILEASLRKALDRHEFEIHYQPQVDLGSGRILGVEALLRWYHPDMGMISPASFIPLAEEIGEIVRIGAWVLEEACCQAKRWHDLGHELKMSVNLSARQFRHRDLAGLVRGALAASGLPARALDLELTESMVMERPDQAINVLRELQSLGVSISVDDFGTGYSSLAYLKRLPIDKLKIDRSFVADIPHDSNDMAITQAVIALAKSLNLEVVAEGVETPEQLAFLRSLGCDWMQGYLFSAAVNADTLGGFLAAEKTL